MKVVVLGLFAGACNQAYGIDETSLPPPPPPPVCPPIGTAPVFSPIFHQFAVQFCTGYTLSADANLGMGLCFFMENRFEVGIGAIDGPLTSIVTPPVSSLVNIEQPMLVPEGDTAYIYENNFDANGSNTFGVYRETDATTWGYVRDLGVPFTPTYGLQIGVPSAGPQRHLMVLDGAANPAVLHEVVGHEDSGWTEPHAAYAANELGTVVESPPNLSPDGLRILFRSLTKDTNVYAVFYADRPSIDARFGLAQPLAGVPLVADAFMTGDCARVYFSGLGSLLYVDQLPPDP